MIVNVIKEYFNVESIAATPLYELKVKTVYTHKGFLPFLSFCEVYVLAVFHSTELPFQEIADKVLRQAAVSGETGKMKKKYIWFVCSDKGGIYLHEALAVGENRTYKKMDNRFIVINTGDGSVSLGPGHILNSALTEKMKSFLERSRFEKKDRLTGDFFSLFDFCAASVR